MRWRMSNDGVYVYDDYGSEDRDDDDNDESEESRRRGRRSREVERLD